MENLENNNIDGSSPVDPRANAVSPSGLSQRIEQQKPKAHHPKGRTGIFVFVIVLFVLIGVGGWWYYAQGQAWMIVKSAKWDWGLQNLENYQQDTSVSLDISNHSNSNQDMYAMFFGGDKIELNVSSQQKNIGPDFESDINLSAKASGIDNLDLSAKTKKIEDKFYFNIDANSLYDLLGGFMTIPDLSDTWFELDIENSYQIHLDNDKLAQVNIKFDNYLSDLKSKGIFNIKDLKNDVSGFRKIQLNIKEDKIDQFVVSSINYSSEMREILTDQKKESLNYVDYKQDAMDSFEKFKNEKPEEWQRFKDAFVSTDFFILVDEDSKIIHGVECHFNNLTFDSEYSSTIINGHIKYNIKSIESYNISKPSNVQKVDDFTDIFSQTSYDTKTEDGYDDILLGSGDDGFYMDHTLDNIDTDGDGLSDMMEAFYGTDVDNPDTDGDGYMDGLEVENGYSPLGEGELYIPASGDIEINHDIETMCNFSGGEWLGDTCDCPENTVYHETFGCM